MVNVDNLDWMPHLAMPDGKRAIHTLENGYVLSIVFGRTLYGDGVETIEVAVRESENTPLIDLAPFGYDDCVAGWLTREEINELAAKIAVLPGKE